MKQPATEIKSQLIATLTIYLPLLSICLLLQSVSAQPWASLNLPTVLQGEIWRLLTAHLIHLDWEHFAMNMIGMGLCMLAFQSHIKPVHWLASFCVIAVFSSLCLLSTYDINQRYMGFSDVLHGWILLGAISIARSEFKLSLAIFVLFWIKIIEENSGLAFFTSGSMELENIATDSHLYGAIGGMLYGFAWLGLNTINSNSNKDPKSEE